MDEPKRVMWRELGQACGCLVTALSASGLVFVTGLAELITEIDLSSQYEGPIERVGKKLDELNKAFEEGAAS